MSCPCHSKQPPEAPAPADAAPARSGSCPACLRKHLLKARGYASEIAEDPSRDWERDRLLENLLLAEDHAAELGEYELRAAIRAARLAAEGGVPSLRQIDPLLARAKALSTASTAPTPGEF